MLAFAHALRIKHVGNAVAFVRNFFKSYELFFAAVVAPNERKLFGFELGVLINNVEGEIEIGFHVHFKIAHQLFVRSKFGNGQKVGYKVHAKGLSVKNSIIATIVAYFSKKQKRSVPPFAKKFGKSLEFLRNILYNISKRLSGNFRVGFNAVGIGEYND